MWTAQPMAPQAVKRKLLGCIILVPGAEKGVQHHCFDDGKTGFGYCFKEHQPGWVLQGIPPTDEEFRSQCPKGAGARSDLLSVKSAIDAGTSIDTLLDGEEHFGTLVHHKKFFEEYQCHKRRRRRFSMPEVHVIYGSTGTNKSKRVFDLYTDADGNYQMERLYKLSAPSTTGQTTWWDGYAGHEAVLIEEFRPGQLKYNELLDITDGYPVKVQVKGSMRDFSPTHIYITSPVSPYEWYPNLTANDKIDQLLRRITSITDTASSAGPSASE